MNKKAIVIGATGLVGQELVKQLINTNEFSKVKLFLRKSKHYDSPKIEVHEVNFDQITDWENLIIGDTLFCCLGTTLKKAKSKEAQFKIDHTYTLLIAKAALSNDCKSVVLVSSLGANPTSSNFYLATKGKLEADLIALQPEKLTVFRPSILDGNRTENRPFEKLALKIMRFLGKLKLIGKYTPTSVNILSTQMIEHALSPSKEVKIIENNH